MILNMAGGGAPFAFIVAEYPEGSTVTCTNSSGGRDIDSTHRLLYVQAPSSGTTQSCVVSCTDGTETAEQTVSGITEGSSHSVTLRYWNGILYDSGDEYISITGGWDLFQPHTAALNKMRCSKDNDVLSIENKHTWEEAGSGAYGTHNAVDLSGFTTLHIKCSATTNYGSQNKVGISTVLNTAVYNNTDGVDIAVRTLGNGTDIEYELAIPSNTTGHIWVGVYSHGNFISGVTVSKVWLT